MTATVSWVVVAAYVVIVLAVGTYFVRRQGSSEAFLLAERTLGTGRVFAATFSTFIGTGILATFASFGYLYGVGALALPVAAVVGFLPLAWASPRIKTLSDRRNAVTLPGLMAGDWGTRTRTVAALLTGGLFAATLAANFLAAGIALQSLAGVPVRVGVVVIGLPVVAATALGGFRGVVWTDVVQMGAIVLLVLVVLPGVALVEPTPGLLDRVPAGHLDPLSFPAPILVVYLLIGVFTFFGSQDLHQRIYAARDGRAARRGLLMFTASLAVVGAAAVLLGVLGRATVSGAPADGVLLALADDAVPAGLLGFVLVGYLALANSDADSQLLTVTSTLTHDVLPLFGLDLGRRERVLVDRVTVAGVGTVGVVVAGALPDLVALVSGIGTAFAILGVAVIGTLYWERTTDVAAFAGLVVGSVATVTVVFATGTFQAGPIVGVLSTAVTMALASVVDGRAAYDEVPLLR